MPAENRKVYVNPPGLRRYRLIFQNGNALPFHARDDKEAISMALEMFDVRGRVTERTFLEKGGKALMCGERQILPRVPEKTTEATQPTMTHGIPFMVD